MTKYQEFYDLLMSCAMSSRVPDDVASAVRHSAHDIADADLILSDTVNHTFGDQNTNELAVMYIDYVYNARDYISHLGFVADSKVRVGKMLSDVVEQRAAILGKMQEMAPVPDDLTDATTEEGYGRLLDWISDKYGAEHKITQIANRVKSLEADFGEISVSISAEENIATRKQASLLNISQIIYDLTETILQLNVAIAAIEDDQDFNVAPVAQEEVSATIKSIIEQVEELF